MYGGGVDKGHFPNPCQFLHKCHCQGPFQPELPQWPARPGALDLGLWEEAYHLKSPLLGTAQQPTDGLAFQDGLTAPPGPRSRGSNHEEGLRLKPKVLLQVTWSGPAPLWGTPQPCPLLWSSIFPAIPAHLAPGKAGRGVWQG